MAKKRAIPTFEVTVVEPPLRKIFKDERKARDYRDQTAALNPGVRVRVEEWHGRKHMRSYE